MRAVDVAVIGGGVIGAACARAAALRGLAVGIFEPGPDPAAASPASAGMLAAQIEPLDNGLVALAVRSRDQYQRLAAELGDTTGIDIGFWAGGIAAIALDDKEADQLKDAVARQRQAGLRCDWLAAADVHERWPGAAPDCHGALFAPEDGTVDPQALTRACLADARRLGAALIPERVEEVRREGGRATGVVTATGATAAAPRCSAAPWSERASTAESRTRGSRRSSAAPSGYCRGSRPSPSCGCGRASVPGRRTVDPSSGLIPTSSACGTPPATAATACCWRR